MTNTHDKLRKLLGKVPSDLIEYFTQISDGRFSGREALELNLLESDGAVRWTNDLRFHPIVDALRGVVLDDANTSNHHIYLSLPACAGSVLFLNHDGDTEIVFASLAEFLKAAQRVIESDNSFRDYHPTTPVILPNQQELSQLVADLYDGHYDCDGNFVVVSLIPSMDLNDVALLTAR